MTNSPRLLRSGKALFVFQGNLCRSLIAMFLLRYNPEEKDLSSSFEVISGGLERSTQAEDMEPRAKKQLTFHDIPFTVHSAHRVSPREFLPQDYILYMESYDRVLLNCLMFGRYLKVSKLS